MQQNAAQIIRTQKITVTIKKQQEFRGGDVRKHLCERIGVV